jgi:hypothetical protein
VRHRENTIKHNTTNLRSISSDYIIRVSKAVTIVFSAAEITNGEKPSNKSEMRGPDSPPTLAGSSGTWQLGAPEL